MLVAGSSPKGNIKLQIKIFRQRHPVIGNQHGAR